MKLIVGLGNLGDEYRNTRHNVGFMFVDFLAEKYGGIFKYDKYMLAEIAEVTINNKKVILAKPQTFMNKSGEAVKKIVIKNALKPEQVFVSHDDLDIKLGDFKISLGKGPKLHNGVGSIEDQWKTKEFWRIRTGVDNRTAPIPGETYVLSSFNDEEKKIINHSFINILNQLHTHISSQSP